MLGAVFQSNQNRWIPALTAALLALFVGLATVMALWWRGRDAVTAPEAKRIMYSTPPPGEQVHEGSAKSIVRIPRDPSILTDVTRSGSKAPEEDLGAPDRLPWLKWDGTMELSSPTDLVVRHYAREIMTGAGPMSAEHTLRLLDAPQDAVGLIGIAILVGEPEWNQRLLRKVGGIEI